MAPGSHEATVLAVAPMSDEPSGAADAPQVSSETAALDARRRGEGSPSLEESPSLQK